MEKNGRRRDFEKWERPGKKMELCPGTGSSGDALWKPYASEGVKGSN
jgi:hypothetical protein